ncbi:MAG: MazG family protein [Planctomycetota bacterium]|nr:MAG: MazG family protein [Planctomycetota bacterium]
MDNLDLGLQQLVNIVAKLRDPQEGCPWDLQQTPQSLSPMMLEECYEVLEAIENRSTENLKEELGDLLLHIVMQAQMAQETNAFSLKEVLQGICQKLVRRHPHVFGQTKAKNVKEVLKNWEEIKAEEAQRSGQSKGKKSNQLPPTVPALILAQEWARKQHWSDPSHPESSPLFEIETLLEKIKQNPSPAERKNTLAQVLLQLAKLASFWEISLEQTLRDSLKNLLFKTDKNPST